MTKFSCERCGSKQDIMVQAVIVAPAEMYAQFSKKNLRKKEVYLKGVMWETADFICKNPKCGIVIGGYGNYVTNLKKENDKLKAEIDELRTKITQ